MMVHVANPIYDSVFKYLMEDDRVAKTILSALLKKEVLEVTMRPHEYTNLSRDSLSMFRVDFAAKVREPDGSDQIVLIELQKTWLDTETLRFRQYLGAQYSNKRNIEPESKKGYAYPMVAVYLLGHRVGNITEPVIYVNHKICDYNGNEVSHGVPDPFVESLVHNSIIVQIPLLHGKVNNRLERVLSVFDQTKKDVDDAQVLYIDESVYADDADMLYVIHRLTAAAADSEMRLDMNVEDEYYSAIEDRDTAIMQREEQLKALGGQLKTLGGQLKAQDDQLKAQDDQLKAQDDQLKAQDDQLKAQDDQLKAQDDQLKAQDDQLKAQDDQLKAQDDQLKAQNNAMCSMIKVMMQQGLTMESIASMTGLPLDKVKRMAEG